jgi:hypothetical protein
MQILHDIYVTLSRLLKICDAAESETQTKRMTLKLLESHRIDDEDYRSLRFFYFSNFFNSKHIGIIIVPFPLKYNFVYCRRRRC